MPLRRNTFLFASTFVFSLAINILVFSLVYLLVDKFAMTSGRVGIYLALGYGSYFLGCGLYQRLEGRITAARGIPAAAAACLVFLVLLWWTPNALTAALGYGLFQGSIGFFWPPLMAWFTRGLSGRALDRDMGRFNQSWITGNLLAPFIGGALYGRNRTLAFWAVAGALFLVILIQLAVLAFLKKNPEDNPAAPEAPKAAPEPLQKTVTTETPESGGAGNRIFAGPEFFRFASWLGILGANAFLGVIINVIPLEIRDVLGHTERTAGLLLLFRGLAAFLGFTLLARYTFWHFNRRWIVLVQGALVILPVLFLAAGNSLSLFVLFLVIFGLFFSGSYNNSLYHSSAGSQNAGKSMAIHEIFITIGAAAGSFGGGLCYQYLGFRRTFLVLAGLEFLCLLPMVLPLFFSSRGKRPAARKGASPA